MSVLIALAALALLMLAAYRGYSVILFAPIAALGAVLLTDPGAVGPTFTGLFMEKMVGFVKLYFPVFLLGAVFGKLIELAGFSRAIVAAAIQILGRRHAIPVIVLVCALLTYGGVSLFVVAFAVYPFAAELFRQSAIPKRLIPATVALGAFSFTWMPCPGRRRSRTLFPPVSLAPTPGQPPGLERSDRCLSSPLVCYGWNANAVKPSTREKVTARICKTNRTRRTTSTFLIR
jgi:H+/gluconate symporter-like permease